VIATFTLLPGLPRSESGRSQLEIPRGRQVLRLKLILEEADARRYSDFTAALNRADANQTWTSAHLSLGRDRTLVVDVPARLFAGKADYDLILRGRAKRGATADTLGYYYLTVVRE
jgi:hypothetical protein